MRDPPTPRINYLFGYGSIINNESRLATGGSNIAVCVRVRGTGYRRCWNFRSTTGFTALGLQKAVNERADINGVVFPVGHDMHEFDIREQGYTRTRITLEQIEVLDYECADECIDQDGSRELREALSSAKGARNSNCNINVWFYVPNESQAEEADENYPICQTYVDVVLGGCLEWGGVEFATELILSTKLWSQYFLNDAPLSRRPWLHRKQYQAIDKLLQTHNEFTFYSKRKHPVLYLRLSPPFHSF